MRCHSAPRTALGFSMLEGLTTLLLVSIAIAIGTPSLSGSLERSRASADIRTLIATLNLARTYALSHSEVTTLCASADGIQCGGDWSDGTLLFSDRNDNRLLDDDDELLERNYALEGGATLSWRASGGRNSYIRFSRSGAAKEFGTFTYCPGSRTAQGGKMLVLNRMGRIRIAQDSDGDGIVENYNGTQPDC